MEETRVLSLTAILGYGYPTEAFAAGMKWEPHAVAVDAGSTDPGPYYLGEGVSFTARDNVKRDLTPALVECRKRGIPLLVGSAGGAGAAPHLRWTVDIVEEIARENRLRFRMAIIPADVPKSLVIDRIRQGAVHPLGPVPPLTEDAVERTVRIVGQMGTEPFMKALEMGAEVIVAGRAYDPAVFAAVSLVRGHDKGLAIHMGKILECGAIAAVPGSGSDLLMGTIAGDSFVVEPPNPTRKCTVRSVAAHSLYEKADPYHLPGPGGVLDLSEVTFEQSSSRAVTVRGSRYQESSPYCIKLEGVEHIGYRCISIAGVRDPVAIPRIDNIIAGVKEQVRDRSAEFSNGNCNVWFHVYGKDGVMGELEPDSTTMPKELAIVIDVVGKTQEIADSVCSLVRSTMLHYGYEGRLSTAGNLAFPFSPQDVSCGPVYRFSCHHLLEVADPCELFPVNIVEVG